MPLRTGMGVLAAGFLAFAGMVALFTAVVHNPAHESEQREKLAMQSLLAQQSELQKKLEVLRKEKQALSAEIETICARNTELESRADSRARHNTRPEAPPEAAMPPRPRTMNEVVALFKTATSIDNAGPAFLVLVDDEPMLVNLASNSPDFISPRRAKAESSSQAYVDPDTRLRFFKPSADVARLGRNVAEQITAQIRAPKNGETIYSLALNGSRNTEWALLDGNVSSEARVIGRYLLTQTSLPFNAVSQGAPVFTADGACVGIFAASTGTMDRTSFMIPGDQLSEALRRCSAFLKEKAARTTVGQRGPTKREIPNAITSIPLKQLIPQQRGFFAGPDRKIVTFDVPGKTIAAFSLKGTSPVWTSEQQGNFSISTQLGSTSAIVLAWGQPSIEINLGDGTIRRKFDHFVTQRLLRCIPYGPEHILATGSDFMFADLRTGTQSLAAMGNLIGHNGNTWYFTDSGGTLGKFNSERVRAILMKAAELRISARDRNNRNSFASTVIQRNKELQAEMISLGVKTKRPSAINQQWYYVLPADDEDRIVAGEEVFKVLPDGLKRLRDLPGEFLTAISPDLAFGATETLLIDLKQMKAVGELPFSATYACFLSDSRHLALYDGWNGRISIFNLGQLLTTKQNP
ncbi:MAG TPA: hypothetical protein VEK08_26775 [Planctomycetota bacterium]|nr:hypothetical protein [Planctomycetota bacterium]